MPWRDLGTGLSWGNLSSTYGHNDTQQYNMRFVTSYVTGSHAAKVGFTFQHAWAWTTQDVANNGVTLQLRNGTPDTAHAVRDAARVLRDHQGQHRPLRAGPVAPAAASRSTSACGSTTSTRMCPRSRSGPGPLVPNRNISFEKVENVPNWKNVSPRLGVSWDVFGNGRTAVKANIGRYLEGPNLTTFTRRANPAAAIVTQATRVWNDTFYPVGDPRRGNFAPDCNLISPLANGECARREPFELRHDEPDGALRRRRADDAGLQLGGLRGASARARCRASR